MDGWIDKRASKSMARSPDNYRRSGTRSDRFRHRWPRYKSCSSIEAEHFVFEGVHHPRKDLGEAFIQIQIKLQSFFFGFLVSKPS